MILTFHSIYDYFALLKAFNTNTLNFHQYISKTNYVLIKNLICTAPNTEKIVIFLLHHLIIQELKKFYLHLAIPIWTAYQIRLKISLPSLHSKNEYKATSQHPTQYLIYQREEFQINYCIFIHDSLSSSTTYFRFFFLPDQPCYPMRLIQMLPNHKPTCLSSHTSVFYYFAICIL